MKKPYLEKNKEDRIRTNGINIHDSIQLESGTYHQTTQ